MKMEFHNFEEDVLFNELLEDLLSSTLQDKVNSAKARLFRYLQDEFVKMP